MACAPSPHVISYPAVCRRYHHSYQYQRSGCSLAVRSAWKIPLSRNLLTIVFYAALMFYYSIPLALIAIAVSLVNLLALRYISRKRVDSNQKLLQDTSRLVGFSSAGLQMIESLKATASESDFFPGGPDTRQNC